MLIIQLSSGGEYLGDIESTLSEATYTRFGLHEDKVETLTLTTIGLGAYQWISLLEVRGGILGVLPQEGNGGYHNGGTFRINHSLNGGAP